MVKYDSSEKQLWNKSFGGSSNDVFKSIIETKNGEIIVAGYSTSTNAGFDNKGNYDAIIVSYDSRGNQEQIDSIKINVKDVKKILGCEKYKKEYMANGEAGIVNGLAWTAVGGTVLPVEVLLMKGKGKVQITGMLGDVMKESVNIAISYIRGNAKKLGINEDFYKQFDMHIHAPEGAIPKDGPSAGVTIATALVSALTGYKVRDDIAMTGEITLKGAVLPIGGLKEKTMAAYKNGLKTVIIPKENESDLEEVEDVVKKSIKFVKVTNISEVLDIAIVK